MATLNFLTSNAGKLAEATDLFAPLGYEVQSFTGEVIEPQADDLGTVALAKIAQGVELLAGENRFHEGLLVEDSGLFIDALGAFPGVYSAHVESTIGCEGILRLLDENRSAFFMTVAAYWTGEVVEVFVGRCDGVIATEMRGEGGFGYDPIFIPLGSEDGRTFAEMSHQEKAEMSHRGIALASLADFLGEQ